MLLGRTSVVAGEAYRLPAELLDKIWGGQVVLFVGNGASMEAGGPSASDLAKRISTAFDLDPTNDLAEAAEAALVGGGGARKKDLDTIIKKMLGVLHPSAAHQQLAHYPWRAIYTTNYDTLIEDAYRNNGQVAVPLKPVITRDDTVDLHDPNISCIFKVHGCISRAPDPRAPLVISISELSQNEARKKEIFLALRDLTQDFSFLFVGYSFKDGLMLKVLSEIREKIGEAWLSRSYAVLPNATGQQKKAFEALGVAHIPLSFGEFFKELEADREARSKRYVAQTRVRPELSVRGKELRISPELFSRIDQDMEILVPDRFHEESTNAFYKGKAPEWDDVHARLDIRRDAYEQVLKDTLDCLNATSGSRVNLLLGSSASGKTTLAMRICYDVLFAHGFPVVRLKPGRRWSRGSLEALQLAFPDTPVLVLADDPTLDLSGLRNLVQYAVMLDLPVAFLLTIRQNDWAEAGESYPLPIRHSTIVPDRLSSKEATRLAERLIEKGLVATSREVSLRDFVARFMTRHEGSLLAILMETVEAKRFELIILQEWDGLQARSPQAAKAYLSIALLHQFGFPVKRELLLRQFSFDPIPWHDDILEKRLAGVVYTEYDDTTYNEYYRTRHSLIASALVNQLRGGGAIKVEDALVDLISTLSWLDEKERDIVFLLAKNHNIRDFLKAPDKVVAFFRALMDVSHENSWILFRYAQWLIDVRRQYDLAEELLQRAIREERSPSRRGAYHHHLGRIEYLRMKSAKTDTERRFFAKNALEHYDNSLRLEPTREFAYNSKAQLLLNLAKTSLEGEDRTKLLAEALAVCEEAKSKVPDFYVSYIRHTMANVLAEMKLLEEAKAATIEALGRASRPIGYYFLARQEVEKSDFAAALSILDKGLDLFSSDRQLLSLAIRTAVADEQFKFKLETYVGNALIHFPSDPFYRLTAGALAVVGGRHREATEHFAIAKSAVEDDFLLYKEHDLGWLASDKRRYRGTITKDRGSVGFILVSGGELTAAYKAYEGKNQQFRRGDHVEFYLKFNYLGPVAHGLELIG